jgi:lincosamide nucleotidyltransferase
MIIQKKMICKVKALCQNDPKLKHALMYGSFAKKKGDAYSDIEFAFFIDDDFFDRLDYCQWLSQIDDIEICFKNMFGIQTVIFSNLVRGEFHFYKASTISTISTWKNTDWFESIEDCLITDKTGELKKYLGELIGGPPIEAFVSNLQNYIDSFYNWSMFGANLLARGEFARALDILWWVQKDLLHIKRINDQIFENFGTPSKELENDLTESDYVKYVSCTSNLEESNLIEAYLNSLKFIEMILTNLNSKYQIEYRKNVHNGINNILNNAI